jgi:hypothetical protein
MGYLFIMASRIVLGGRGKGPSASHITGYSPYQYIQDIMEHGYVVYAALGALGAGVTWGLDVVARFLLSSLYCVYRKNAQRCGLSYIIMTHC